MTATKHRIFPLQRSGYLEYPLRTVELLDERSTLWGFDCASCDADILRQQYDSGELAVSSAKSVVNAYNILARQA